MKRRILVIEDELAIRRGVIDALHASGYSAIEASDGVAGLDAAQREPLDLLLLDLVLPRRDGMDVLRELRRLRPALPVIILTARGTEADRVAGLKSGADDYVVKPFSARELLARVEAVLRRCAGPHSNARVVSLGSAEIDLARREIRRGGTTRIELSDTEVAILELLLTHRDRVVTRDEMLARVWGITDAETRTIDMHVARLRQKLRDPADTTSESILTVRGQGYKIVDG